MKKVWKIVGAVAAVIVVLCGGFLYWTTWSGSTKEIESVAGQFKPDSSWEQIDNQVIPPMTVCLDSECPSVHRSWKTGENLTKEDFQRVLENSNWKFSIEGDCKPRSNITSSGGHTLCSAIGMQDDYSINLVVMGDYENTLNGHIVLFVNK